ncbi:MAG TPA: hypothetical protein VHP30_09640 [Ignavibacteriales bacterium]|nr:hypothetical protein [Ignavibacteriales bacterium]
MNRLLQTLNPDRLFFIILLLFLFQEGIFIDKRVTVDEVWHSVPAYRAHEDGAFTVRAMKEWDGSYSKLYQLGGYQSALIIWHEVFPKEIIYSRMFSLLFGAFILLTLYSICKRIWKNSYWAALPPALLAADNLFFITSITVRSDIIIAAGIPSILHIVYDRDWNLKPNRLFIAGLITLIFASMHPNFLLAAASLFAAYLIVEAKHNSLKQNAMNILLFTAPYIILAIAALIYGSIKGLDIIAFITPYVMKTSELSAVLSLDFGSLFREEWNRYLDFIQFPFRLHLFLILLLSTVVSFFSNEKIIKLMSVITLTVMVLFYMLDSKTVRYFVLILPLMYVSLSFIAYRIYISAGAVFKRASISALILVIAISLGGNAYLIIKHWNTNYKDFSNALYFKPQDGKNIIGDLILWDTFKKADFSAYPGLGLEINNYDYVIARYGVFGNNNIIMTRTNTFAHAGNKKRRDEGYKIIEGAISKRGTLIKEVDHPYYGNFKIYRMNRGKN